MFWFVSELATIKKYMLEGSIRLAYNYHWQPSELYNMDIDEIEMWMDQSIELKRKIDREAFLNRKRG